MIVNIDRLHIADLHINDFLYRGLAFSFAGMNRTAVLAFSPALARIELFKQRWQIFDDALQLHFRAIDQLVTVRAVPFKGIQRAFGARHFNYYSDGVSGALW